MPLPLIAPGGALQRATAVSSGAAQLATITGPALGGFAYAVAPGLPYGIMVAFWLAGAVLTGGIKLAQGADSKASTSGDLFAGVRSVVGTAKRKGVDAYQAIVEILRGGSVLQSQVG